MRPVRWLQISDFHLRAGQEWAQDVVLSEMCRDIEMRQRQAEPVDFVLATGDLAFSGKALEYELARAFFDEVARVTSVPPDRFFLIPGNHDVDRSRQRLAFTGARQTLRSQNEVDLLLGSIDELNTLRERQASYHQFQAQYSPGQEREWTPDGLGYVSMITLDDLRIAVLGLNSAWLAEGGAGDHGRLLVGERQVIDALRIANGKDVHLLVAMGHHPFHLLNEFDRRPVRRRITEFCHFYHCGHLHDPENYSIGTTETRCLIVSSGASFDSRHKHNAYSSVELDVMKAESAITTIMYKPTDGAFSYVSRQTFPLVIQSASSFGVGELGAAIEATYPSLERVSHLLAALLLDMQTEVPIIAKGSCAFGSLEVLRAQAGAALREETIAFFALRSPLRIFGRHMTLEEFLVRYGSALAKYGSALITLGKDAPDLRDRLDDRDANARMLAGVEPVRPFMHTLTLLRALAQDRDWDLLREQAERHLEVTNAEVVAEARRMLALALANLDGAGDFAKAVEIYREMVDDGSAQAEDVAALVSLLTGARDYESAKEALGGALERFPGAADRFRSLVHAVVEATGDREFRDELTKRQLEGSAE